MSVLHGGRSAPSHAALHNHHPLRLFKDQKRKTADTFTGTGGGGCRAGAEHSHSDSYRRLVTAVTPGSSVSSRRITEKDESESSLSGFRLLRRSAYVLKNTNGGKVSSVASSVEDCIHPVRSCGAPVPQPASPWRSSLWLHTALALWFYQSTSLLPLFPALHVDSYHWTNGVSCVQTRRYEKGGKKRTEEESRK